MKMMEMEQIDKSIKKWLEQRKRNVPFVPFCSFWNGYGTLMQQQLS